MRCPHCHDELAMMDNWLNHSRLCRAKVDLCVDCDGLGKYPSGAKCKSCGGSGRVLAGDGISVPATLN